MAVSKWKDKFILDAYELARSGMNDTEIAKTFGVSPGMFIKWKSSKPIFDSALKKARKQLQTIGSSQNSFQEYVNNKLSPQLRPLWDKLMAFDRAGSGIEKIEALLKNCGVYVRQMLFIHAYVASGFRLNPALRKAGVSYGRFKAWKENDPNFPALLEEVMFYRKNWLEDALFGLVDAGDSNAIRFANERLNKDRGYGKPEEDLNVNIEGQIEHTVTRIDELGLPIEVRKELLKAIRRKQIESKEVVNE